MFKLFFTSALFLFSLISPRVIYAQDITCAGGNGIRTAIGCIFFTNINAFVVSFLLWGITIGGGIAFLFIVYSGFLIMTSSGDPERLKAGQELLVSAISGLIMLILSVFILRIIGVDLLKIF